MTLSLFHRSVRNRKPGSFPGLDFCRFENSKIPGNPCFFGGVQKRHRKFRKPGICETLKKYWCRERPAVIFHAEFSATAPSPPNGFINGQLVLALGRFPYEWFFRGLSLSAAHYSSYMSYLQSSLPHHSSIPVNRDFSNYVAFGCRERPAVSFRTQFSATAPSPPNGFADGRAVLLVERSEN